MLPSSPRKRRRLLLAASALVAVGVIVGVFTLIPSHGPSAPGPTGNEGAAQLASATRPVRLTAADRRAIDRTLDRFLPAAMERHDPAVGWQLAGPEMKAGSTLAEWRRGTSPVPYYPAREQSFHDWQTIDVGRRYVVFNLLVHPAKGSKLAPYVFSGQVVKERGRWLVNRLYTIAIMNRVTKTTHEIGPADFAAGASAGAQASPDKAEHPSHLLPVLAVLAAIALLPLTLGGIALRRTRRWRRQVKATGRSEIPALPARYRD